jgi:hypothetical protein
MISVSVDTSVVTRLRERVRSALAKAGTTDPVLPRGTHPAALPAPSPATPAHPPPEMARPVPQHIHSAFASPPSRTTPSAASPPVSPPSSSPLPSVLAAELASARVLAALDLEG